MNVFREQATTADGQLRYKLYCDRYKMILESGWDRSGLLLKWFSGLCATFQALRAMAGNWMCKVSLWFI